MAYMKLKELTKYFDFKIEILEENLLFPDEEIDQQRGVGDGAFLKMPRPQLAYFLPVTVHSVTSNLRKSI